MISRKIGLLAGGLLLAGCSGAGSADLPVAPAESGKLALRMVRAANSQIPAAADSAVVRVWNAGTSFDQVKTVPVPPIGSATSVDFSVPSGGGYSIGIMAFKAPQYEFRNVVAGGRADNVTVVPAVSTPVSVDVKPWTITVTGPDTVISGAAVTFVMTVTGGPVEDFFGSLANAHISLDPTFRSSPLNPNMIRSGNTVTATFNAPTVASDTAMFLAFGMYADYGPWQFNGLSFAADFPSLWTGVAPIRRPLRVPGGSITVSFDKHAAASRLP